MRPKRRGWNTCQNLSTTSSTSAWNTHTQRNQTCDLTKRVERFIIVVTLSYFLILLLDIVAKKKWECINMWPRKKVGKTLISFTAIFEILVKNVCFGEEIQTLFFPQPIPATNASTSVQRPPAPGIPATLLPNKANTDSPNTRKERFRMRFPYVQRQKTQIIKNHETCYPDIINSTSVFELNMNFAIIKLLFTYLVSAGEVM